MNAVEIKLELPLQQYEQLTAIAQARQLSVAEITKIVVAEWLQHQEQLEHARDLMRQLGQGLGQGHFMNDTARNHDAYLYSRTSNE
jgi:hypothetical protein